MEWCRRIADRTSFGWRCRHAPCRRNMSDTDRFGLSASWWTIWSPLDGRRATSEAASELVSRIRSSVGRTSWAWRLTASRPSDVQGMTLNCIHIFIVIGSFLYWSVMRPASQRFFKHSYISLRILIISYLATFLGTNSLSVLMCRKAVNQSFRRSRISCAAAFLTRWNGMIANFGRPAKTDLS